MTNNDAIDYLRHRADRIELRLDQVEIRLEAVEKAVARLEGRLIGYMAAASIAGGILLFLAQIVARHMIPT